MKKVLLKCGLILLLGLALFAALAMAPLQVQPTTGNTGLLDGDGSGTPGTEALVRFRVIAASDRPADQALKLQVRDAVLDYLRPQLQGAVNKGEAVVAIGQRLPQIQELAVSTLRSGSCVDPVKVCWGVTDFPAKGYGPLIFPSGDYLALKIVIGEGEGKNWWCVLFPPLCYVDLTRGAPDSNVGRRERGDNYDHQVATPVQALTGNSGNLERNLPVRLASKRTTAGRQDAPRLTTKIGEWFSGRKGRTLLSLSWWRRS